MSHRIYPPHFPRFDGEPTRDRFRVDGVGEMGEGLITLVDFSPGDLVMRFHGIIRNTQTLYTLQERPGVYIDDPWVSGKVIHHCDPNCDVDVAARTFTANRPIAAGDLITMDYDTTEDELFRAFHCHCGAKQCRGRIAGARHALQRSGVEIG